MVEMKKVWQARRLILSGESVKDIATKLSISEGIVRTYTKSERAKIKQGKEKKEFIASY